MVHEEKFELLFAFALRQCNLTYLNKFLEYHLDKNFEGHLKKFIGFLVLIKRKFEEPLFSKGLIDATDNWIKEWEIDLKDSGGEKIKAHLSVEQLAFIFRALHECKLIEGNNAKLIGRVVSRAFNSKAKEDFSPGNLSKKYYELSDDTLEFWLYQFSKMEAFARRQLEKK